MSRNDESSLNMSDNRADSLSGSLASHAPRAGYMRPASLAPRRVLKFVLALALLMLIGLALYVYMPAQPKLHTHPKPHLQPQPPTEPPLQSPPESQPEPEPQPHPKPPSQPQERFPPVHATDFRIHDPSIIRVGDAYYSYSVGQHIRIHQAPSLDGPWKRTGTVLEADSIIPKGDRKAPWAPQTIHYGDTYYCFYAVSNSGCRDSAIGVATSKSPGPGAWTDHGVLVQSGTGEGSGKRPFAGSNTIDPSVIVTPDGQGYLMFGSFWSGIWQVPLSKNLLSVSGDTPVEARQLVYMEEAPLPAGNNPNPLCREPSGARPIEGSFISYREPWYYLWFSYGKCCKFDVQNLPPPGREYSIRVGRSKNPRGPFIDKQGRDLAKGGGEIVYASNRDVYAPGGQGVLTEESGDVLYYHYLNKSMSYEFGEARLGYNPLEYVDGWPVPQ